MYTTYIQHIYKDIYILYIIHIQYCACQYLNIYSKWLYLYLSVILFYQTICLCEKFQFFRKTIIRSTNSHYDFYTNKSLLGGRSAQFVAQFYNKRTQKKKKNKQNRKSIIDYRVSKSNSSRIEAARNCVWIRKLCWAWQGPRRASHFGGYDADTHIYISSWSKSMDGKGFEKANARL